MPAAAATTAGWAALLVAAPLAALALIAWVAESRSGTPALDAVRLAANGWLAAHGARLHTVDGPFTFVPLLLTAVIVRQIYRAGRHTARATGAASWPDVFRVAAAIAVAYGAFGMVVALLGATDAVRADAVDAGLATAAVAAVGGGWGAVRSAGVWAPTVARLPVVLRTGGQAGVVAALVVLTAGVLTVAVRLVVAAAEVRELASTLRTGVVGSVALLLLCAAYAPTAGIWAAAYLIGPGFAVGAGATVDASSVNLVPLPAFPLLAAVPTGPASAMASLILGVPLLAGILGGILVARPRSTRVRAGGVPVRWRTALSAALVAGPVAGLLVGLAAALARGSLGDGRLATVGPAPVQVGLVLTVEVSVAALVGATVARTVTSFKAVSSGRGGSLPAVWRQVRIRAGGVRTTAATVAGSVRTRVRPGKTTPEAATPRPAEAGDATPDAANPRPVAAGKARGLPGDATPDAANPRPVVGAGGSGETAPERTDPMEPAAEPGGTVADAESSDGPPSVR